MTTINVPQWTSATAQNAAVTIDTVGQAYASVTLVASGSISGGVVSFESSQDTVTWTALNMDDLGGTDTATSASAETSSAWQVAISTARQVRARLSTVISGTGSLLVQVGSAAGGGGGGGTGPPGPQGPSGPAGPTGPAGEPGTDASGALWTAIYVDPVNGNDSNKGNSWGQAVLTIAHAMTLVGNAGALYLAPGTHDIGTASSSATGLVLPQAVSLIGIGPAYPTTGGGSELGYLGTGIAVQATSSNTYSQGQIENVLISNYATGTIGLELTGAVNACTIRNVTVGSTGTLSKCFSTSALVMNTASQSPDFVNFYNCWFIGGSIPVNITVGIDQINFWGCGVDTDDTTTIGLQVNAGANTKNTVRLAGFKMELHNGISSGITAGTATAGGSVDDGVHWWGITMVTAAGESGMSIIPASAKKTVSGGNQTLPLTLPLRGGGLGARVTSRNIYRTKIASTATFYLLHSVSDNTTTTYTDTTADASLGSAYSQPAAGAVGNPIPYQLNAPSRYVCDVEAYADGVCTGAAVSYTVTTAGFAMGVFGVNTLNYPEAFAAPNVGTPLLLPGTPTAQNTVFQGIWQTPNMT